jgi:hypothetical protein
MNIEFALPQAVPYLNTSATNVGFFMWYPEGKTFWELKNGSGVVLRVGNYTFTQQVMDTWDSDQDLIDAMIAASPWNI